ncbi:uncharacterized protein CMC5_009150 [Chondromyces crocatus]|uniref:Uncharacterized protein n=1 Tax=Chondromyces crocatus TaxID=52 RepID=A0A0K1E7F4_CHOCO|nr:uncharacterized protein CMC5_009150 [Chondromyces crocatus]
MEGEFLTGAAGGVEGPSLAPRDASGAGTKGGVAEGSVGSEAGASGRRDLERGGSTPRGRVSRAGVAPTVGRGVGPSPRREVSARTPSRGLAPSSGPDSEAATETPGNRGAAGSWTGGALGSVPGSGTGGRTPSSVGGSAYKRGSPNSVAASGSKRRELEGCTPSESMQGTSSSTRGDTDSRPDEGGTVEGGDDEHVEEGPESGGASSAASWARDTGVRTRMLRSCSPKTRVTGASRAAESQADSTALSAGSSAPSSRVRGRSGGSAMQRPAAPRARVRKTWSSMMRAIGASAAVRGGSAPRRARASSTASSIVTRRPPRSVTAAAAQRKRPASRSDHASSMAPPEAKRTWREAESEDGKEWPVRSRALEATTGSRRIAGQACRARQGGRIFCDGVSTQA